MDLSYWAKFNPEVAFETTQKQFFGKYVLRITYNIPSALYINKAEPGKIQEHLTWRELQSRTRTGFYSGGYNSYWTRDITAKTNVAQLEHFGEIKRKHELKYRLEANLFGIYSNDETELKAFHNDILPAYQNALYAITCPKDAAHQQLLEDGHITGKNKKGYKYKVTMRDGRYDAAAKLQLVNYFDSLGDVVSMSKATRRSLANGHSYTFGIYIHTSDPTILSFVELIVPGIVNKTYEITKI